MTTELPPAARACFVRHGRRGGKAKSAKKAKSSRRNGKLGGRPKKKK
jgi:hypothetical protein